MVRSLAAPWLPKPVGVLLALYVAASLLHLVHNADYIAFYPTMPLWVTPERVYAVWLGTAAVGAGGLLAHRLGRPGIGAVLLALYGLVGLLGLAHYALPLCAQHNPATDLTIILSTGTGLLLALACVAPR